MTEIFDPLRKLLLDVCSPVKAEAQTALLKQRLLRVDPERLAKLAAIEFLTPIFYYNLRNFNLQEYKEVLPQLKNSYMTNTARNILLLKQIKSLKHQAERNGIDIILLKGSALSISIYNEVGLRPMADVDIFVRQRHVEKIKEFMERDNMHPLFTDINQNWFSTIRSHIVPYQSSDNTLSLEAHTRLFDDRFIHFTETDPFQKTREIKWDNGSFVILEPYTAFIYVLYHFAIHHNFSFRLRDMLDLAYMISAYTIKYEKILPLIEDTHAQGLFMPFIDTAFELAGIKSEAHGTARLNHAYVYWTNSVAMKYIPIQISSRLSDATLRIATVLTCGIRRWGLQTLKPTGYEISLFYKTTKQGGLLKRAGMILWIIGVCIGYTAMFPLFYIITKIKKD